MNPLDQNSDIPKMPIPDNSDGVDDSQLPNPALDMIRQKLSSIYDDAPASEKEIEEIKGLGRALSEHQQFIYNLQKSGTNQANLQKAWHNYYLSQSDREKNVIWQEFYAANKQAQPALVTPSLQPIKKVETLGEKTRIIGNNFLSEKPLPLRERRKTTAEIKQQILRKVEKHRQKKWWQGLHSLGFGLAIGFFVLLILMFSFFNETFIAPFITPSSNISAQSLIIDPNASVSPNPIIIIPKINVELPVIYTLATTDENTIENSLEDGVIHYPTTAYPGQLGNGAIFGHSSNNILNPGKYKFAFVLLHDLQIGDTFTLDYNGTAYVYQIFERNIVSPNDVSVLNDIPGHAATFTLITCDPPGTSINRLIVVGDQISPSPSANVSGPNQNAAAKPSTLPSNSPSLWSRLLSIF